MRTRTIGCLFLLIALTGCDDDKRESVSGDTSIADANTAVDGDAKADTTDTSGRDVKGEADADAADTLGGDVKGEGDADNSADTADASAEDARDDRVVVTLAVKKGFPDLWGEGASTIEGGGANGVKFFVTSLADTEEANFIPASPGVEAHYEGTIRGALSLEEPRHIIPRVSGAVDLGSGILLDGYQYSHFTYHGHLAPEGGFSLTNNNLVIRRNRNIVVRFLRARYGRAAGLAEDDALLFYRAHTFAVDHSSLAWAGDETFSIGTTRNTPYPAIIGQNNIVGQTREGHNTGSLIGYTSSAGGAQGVVSWHNNVYVGVSHRTPNFAGDSEMFGRIFNNITYDWQSRLTNLVGAPTVDVAYNYYKKGPTRSDMPSNRYNKYQDLRESRPYPPSIYTAGNIMPGVLEDPGADNQQLWTLFQSVDPVPVELFRTTPLPVDSEVGYQPSTAEQAYARNVLAKEAGANRTTDSAGNPVIGLDSVDDHYLEAIANGTDPRTPEANWVHPPVPSNTPFPDANKNGIADAFEAAHGITSADEVIVDWDFGEYLVANEAGYTAFEMYSAWVAGDFERLAQ
ncbi:hypothetical protein [Bradymonas sediminis]|uniref:Uncharacterized protein n=1 Tax=Bradymonas sediminis TaxID=1548548 RepID=A0A2Z4FIE3_9DELT|nr:hypothetical protein [Bradymonas sediminis]AWV88683.1 hypothetical protein DN745_04755 [Bradymonas sediminis]TDP63629.1 hypothetical protein DFR33_11087 [Bradymonas sediminis]